MTRTNRPLHTEIEIRLHELKQKAQKLKNRGYIEDEFEYRVCIATSIALQYTSGEAKTKLQHYEQELDTVKDTWLEGHSDAPAFIKGYTNALAFLTKLGL